LCENENENFKELGIIMFMQTNNASGKFFLNPVILVKPKKKFCDFFFTITIAYKDR
jgi:hypothetical protein